MIKIHNAHKTFDKRGIAGIHGISLEIPKGSIYSLMGPNGSGKTTLLNMIAGKWPLDSGSIEVQGDIHFFEKRNPSPELNVQTFLMNSVQDESIPTEKRIQLSRDFADIFEFTFQLRQSMGQLSQGQRQKVLMAAELINQPDILFLDEPFIHLDPMSRKDILKDLFHFLKQREVTVIWITHETDEAFQFADQIGLLQHGRMEQTSRPLEILKSPRNLFVAQFFGHQNFIKVIRQGVQWMTPWGLSDHALAHAEGYLVIPPMAWKINELSQFTGTIIHLRPSFFCWDVEIEVEEKRFLLKLPLMDGQELKLGQKINVSADLSHCLVIPL
jgi:ABC-type Fe3+/spermidine/putrescine transport system ATPase subunit